MDIRSNLRMSLSEHGPVAQKTYTFASGSWQPSIEKLSSAPITAIRLITWNIDAQNQGGPIRMAGALRYLETLVATFPADLPVVVFFQEMVPNDLKLLRASPWIRARFALTDLDPINWKTSYYGTTALVDARVPLTRIFRVYYKDTQMDRDALFIDISIAAPPSSISTNPPRILRLCNTHLESLVSHPPLRPAQLAEAARHLHSPAVHAGVLAGDLNAIEPFDRTLPAAYALKDAYLEAGGREDAEEGFTWGYQSYAELRERFGCGRLDKMLFCGGVVLKGLQRVGVGVQVEEGKRAKMRSFGALEWVTDHYGLMAEVVVVG